jgi:hypothetical protein
MCRGTGGLFSLPPAQPLSAHRTWWKQIWEQSGCTAYLSHTHMHMSTSAEATPHFQCPVLAWKIFAHLLPFEFSESFVLAVSLACRAEMSFLEFLSKYLFLLIKFTRFLLLPLKDSVFLFYLIFCVMFSLVLTL